MAESKTKPTKASVKEFLNAVEHPTRKADGLELFKMLKEIAKENPRMWGPTIVGFGTYHYKYESGREGNMAKIGFSPRKQSLSVYIMGGFDKYKDLLDKLGKHKIGKGCLYINKLADVDNDVLDAIIKRSYDQFE
ncbi:MAG: DUF1801 domain-containing protein [Candidatus Thorarchaeota archaeon]